MNDHEKDQMNDHDRDVSFRLQRLSCEVRDVSG